MNKNSSRSHTIFRMVVESRSRDANPDDAQVGEALVKCCKSNNGADGSCGSSQMFTPLPIGPCMSLDECLSVRAAVPAMHAGRPVNYAASLLMDVIPCHPLPLPPLSPCRTLVRFACLPSPWWTWQAASALPRLVPRASAPRRVRPSTRACSRWALSSTSCRRVYKRRVSGPALAGQRGLSWQRWSRAGRGGVGPVQCRCPPAGVGGLASLFCLAASCGHSLPMCPCRRTHPVP